MRPGDERGVDHLVVVVQQVLLEHVDVGEPLGVEVVLAERVEQPPGEDVDGLHRVGHAAREEWVDEASGVSEQEPAVAHCLVRRVLHPVGTDVLAHRAGARELALDEGEPADVVPELLGGGHRVVARVVARVELQAHAAQRVGRRGVVVERDDPDPPALEHVVHGADVPRERRPVLLARMGVVVERVDADHG
jgi:hypothetical protein